MKKTGKDTSKWKDSLCSWIRRINIVKRAILPKAIYRFNVILIKTPAEFSQNQSNLKISVKTQKTQIAKAILRKKSKASDIMRFYFEIYYKAAVIKTVWYCHKNTDT